MLNPSVLAAIGLSRQVSTLKATASSETISGILQTIPNSTLRVMIRRKTQSGGGESL